jgi:hypothetical protein
MPGPARWPVRFGWRHGWTLRHNGPFPTNATLGMCRRHLTTPRLATAQFRLVNRPTFRVAHLLFPERCNSSRAREAAEGEISANDNDNARTHGPRLRPVQAHHQGWRHPRRIVLHGARTRRTPLPVPLAARGRRAVRRRPARPAPVAQWAGHSCDCLPAAPLDSGKCERTRRVSVLTVGWGPGSQVM